MKLEELEIFITKKCLKEKISIKDALFKYVEYSHFNGKEFEIKLK